MDPAGSARTMGTRDDEYDYLFKGTASGAQMDEVPAADRRAEVPSWPLGPGRSPRLGVRRDRQLRRPGQAGLHSFGPAYAILQTRQT